MKTGAAAVALILAGMFGPAAALADPLPIRVGWVVTPGHLAPLIEALGKREAGVFKHLGQSYVLQTTRFQGTTPQIQAQAIGDLDVAALSTAALALAITNAKLEERVVADVVADGVEGFFTENYVVAADSPIKTIEDIKGKRIATNAIGSASDAAMRTMFRKHGIKDADFTTVETNFANMPAMLDGGKVDLIGTLPQFLQELRSHPSKYRVLFSFVGDARRDDRGAPAGLCRFFRGSHPRGPLVYRPEQSGGGTRYSGRCDEIAEGEPRLRFQQG